MGSNISGRPLDRREHCSMRCPNHCTPTNGPYEQDLYNLRLRSRHLVSFGHPLLQMPISCHTVTHVSQSKRSHCLRGRVPPPALSAPRLQPDSLFCPLHPCKPSRDCGQLVVPSAGSRQKVAARYGLCVVRPWQRIHQLLCQLQTADGLLCCWLEGLEAVAITAQLKTEAVSCR